MTNSGQTDDRSTTTSWSAGTRLQLSKILPAARYERRYAINTLVESAGIGLLLTTSVVFLTRFAGLSPGEVGGGLSIAGIVGLAASIPAGRLGDRWGHRSTLIMLNCARGLLLPGYLLIRSFPEFLTLICLIALADAGASPCRGAFVSELFGSHRRVAVTAYNRSVYNVGISLGSVGAAVALAAGTKIAFRILILGDAASYLLAAFVLATLPSVASIVPIRRDRGRPPLQGYFRLHFMALALLCGVINIEEDVLAVALPLWIVRKTSAPHPLIAILLILNTALVVLFQVRASRGAATAHGAALAGQRGGVTMLVACGLCATTVWLSAVPAVAVLVAAITVMTFGEMLGAAAGWGLAYAFAPKGRQGTFLGMWGLGSQVASVGGPGISTALTVGAGPVGWVALGLLFLAAGAAQLPASRQALKRTGSED